MNILATLIQQQQNRLEMNYHPSQIYAYLL